MNEEVEGTIWKGGPSQLLNLGHYLIGLVLIAAIVSGAVLWQKAWVNLLVLIPLGWMAWRYLVLRCLVFELTSQRLRLFEGVLNQKIGEVELYRVKDNNIERPFWLRIFGLSSIRLDTSDRTTPLVELKAIKDGLNVRELIRKQVELLRDRKRVREVDFEDSDDGGDLELENL